MQKTMPDRVRSTLLDFAIAASVAVLPVLLAVLLGVAALRPAETAPKVGPAGGDRHVSVRQVAALKTFERAIVRRSAVSSSLPSADSLPARVAACRSEWGPRSGVLARLQATLAGAAATPDWPARRIAEQLAEIDRALVRFSNRENRRVAEAVGLDADRWFEAVGRTLAAPVDVKDYPGVRFAVHCDDIAAAVRTLPTPKAGCSTASPGAAPRWRG